MIVMVKGLDMLRIQVLDVLIEVKKGNRSEYWFKNSDRQTEVYYCLKEKFIVLNTKENDHIYEITTKGENYLKEFSNKDVVDWEGIDVLKEKK